MDQILAEYGWLVSGALNLLGTLVLLLFHKTLKVEQHRQKLELVSAIAGVRQEISDLRFELSEHISELRVEFTRKLAENEIGRLRDSSKGD